MTFVGVFAVRNNFIGKMQRERMITQADFQIKTSGNYSGNNALQKSFRRTRPTNKQYALGRQSEQQLNKLLQYNRKERPLKGKRTDSNLGSVHSTSVSVANPKGNGQQRSYEAKDHQQIHQDESQKTRLQTPQKPSFQISKPMPPFQDKLEKEKKAYIEAKERLQTEEHQRCRSSLSPSPFKNAPPHYSQVYKTPLKTKPTPRLIPNLRGTIGVIQLQPFRNSKHFSQVFRLHKEVKLLQDERVKYEHFFEKPRNNAGMVVFIAEHLDSVLNKLTLAFRYYEQLVAQLLNEQ